MQQTTHMRTRSRRPNTHKIPTISFGNLPPELIQEILLKVAIKSLVRSTSVCKSWKSLVKSPIFFSTHLETSLSASKNSKDNDPLLHIRQSFEDGNIYYTLPSEEERIIPFPSCCWVSGSCNGLVCLRDVNDSIILWNPLIKKWLSLPKVEWNFEDGDIFILAGLGFDIRTNDYKVLRIAEARIDQFSVGQFVAVYSLKSNSWKRVDSAFASGFNSDTRVCFACGSLHYVAGPVVNGSRKVIVVFDVGDEVFREIMLPEGLQSLGLNSLHVLGYGGGSSIAVVKYLAHNSFLCRYHCEVWVMRVYSVVESWTKLLRVRDPAYCLEVLGFRKNGEVLMERWEPDRFHDSDGEADNEEVVLDLDGYGISIVSCDPKSKEFKPVWGLNYDGWSYVNSYVGSLALLDIGYPIADQRTTDSDATGPKLHREA